MNYELSFIISSVVPETEHKAVQDDILSYIKKINGKISKEPYSIGRKKLTYPIKKQKHGFYVFLEFELEETAGLKRLEKHLTLTESVLRHLIIKKDKNIKDDFLNQEKPKPVKKAAPVKKEAKPKPIKKEEIKIDLDDKKLDEILDQDPTID